MKKVATVAAIAAITILAGCGMSKKATIPLNGSVKLDDTYTIIWNGISKAYRYEKGQWLRVESYDYQFDVVQKRYDNRWESVKSLHRIHPDYDGRAGNRDQTIYFEVAYKGLPDNKVQADIRSTLGNGTGTTDNEFRRSVLVMYVPGPGKFMPYNKFRITQQYNYEEGILTETVELINEKGGREIPFMKNEETALIFTRSKLDKAPTSFKP